MHKNIILGKDDTTCLQILPNKTIFWTGAGISCIKPSSLPLGNGLTDAYLKAALGPKWKDFVVLWNNHFPQIKDAVKDGKWTYPASVGTYTVADVDSGVAWQRPRLEYIIGEMDKLDKYFASICFEKTENQSLFARGSSLAALKSFAHIEPCLYHYRLADLTKAGAIMVTSNFDDGIEMALFADSDKIVQNHGMTAVDTGNGYIYHFHGVATDKSDNLGATISAMSKGLDEKFESYLESCFESGYDIVFVGYGGVDFFDAEPFFKRLKGKDYPGKAIYLQWCPDITKREDKAKKDKSYKYLLEPFHNQYIAYADTDEFFKAIWDSYTDVTTLDRDCGAFKSAKDTLQKIVDDQIDAETYYFLNMFRLCSQLNISPGRFYPDWIERISKLFTRWKEDGNETLWRMSVVDGQKNDGIIDDIFSNNWHDEKLNATGMVDELRPYMNAWNRKHQTIMLRFNRACWGYGFPLPRKVIRNYVDKTKEILKEKKTDEVSVDISRGTVMYLCGWQTKLPIFLYQKSHGLIKRRMLFLKQCIEELLEYPFTRFRYRTHYLSLCRQLAYINAAIHRSGYEGDIQKEWDICMQTPNLFDAGQVLNARLIEAKQYQIKTGVDELKAIRQRILDLRKP